MTKTKRSEGPGGAGAGRALLERRYFTSLMGNNSGCRFQHLSWVIVRQHHAMRTPTPSARLCGRATMGGRGGAWG